MSCSRAPHSAAAPPASSSTVTPATRLQIEALGFPAFARGLSPLDTFARRSSPASTSRRASAGSTCDPETSSSGTSTGSSSIPQDLAAEVAEAVVTKHRLEGNARADLLAGMGIREVWKKYGVL